MKIYIEEIGTIAKKQWKLLEKFRLKNKINISGRVTKNGKVK